MNSNVSKWIDALRSGKYEQTKGKLRYDRTEGEVVWCALGVGCDVFKNDTGKGKWRTYFGASAKFEVDTEKSYGIMPTTVRDHYDLCILDARNISNLNDAGKTFAEIADWMEEELAK